MFGNAGRQASCTYHQKLLLYSIKAYLFYGVQRWKTRVLREYPYETEVVQQALFYLSIPRVLRLVWWHVHHTLETAQAQGKDVAWRCWHWPSMIWRIWNALRPLEAALRATAPPGSMQTSLKDTCPICLESEVLPHQRAIVLEPCGHGFHLHCLLAWCDTNPNSTCPCCRTRI